MVAAGAGRTRSRAEVGNDGGGDDGDEDEDEDYKAEDGNADVMHDDITGDAETAVRPCSRSSHCAIAGACGGDCRGCGCVCGYRDKCTFPTKAAASTGSHSSRRTGTFTNGLERRWRRRCRIRGRSRSGTARRRLASRRGCSGLQGCASAFSGPHAQCSLNHSLFPRQRSLRLTEGGFLNFCL